MDNRTKGQIRGAIKRVWQRHPLRLAILKSVRVEEPAYRKDGTRAKKDAVFYICCKCGGKAKATRTKNYPQIHIDHIDPVVPIGVNINSLSFDEFVERVFTTPDNLQPLCSDCHDTKTQAENKERRKVKNAETV